MAKKEPAKNVGGKLLLVVGVGLAVEIAAVALAVSEAKKNRKNGVQTLGYAAVGTLAATGLLYYIGKVIKAVKEKQK